MKHTKKALFLTLLVSSMALVGCGGGDQSSKPAGGSSSGAPQSTSAGGQSSAASQESSADPSLPKYEVTIDYEDGVTPQKQEYSHGDHLAKPQDPTKDQFTFVYWTYENAEYDFNKEVSSDMTLKAIWKEIKIVLLSLYLMI